MSAGCTWVLDLIARDSQVLLSATDPRRGTIGTEPIGRWDAVEIARAFLVLATAAHPRPTTVITDGSHLFEGIGATIGAEQQVTTFTDRRRLARLEKLL